MKWAHRLLGLLLGALLLGVSFRVLLSAFQGGNTWIAFLDAAAFQRKEIIGVCLLFIFSLVGYVLTGLIGTPRAKYLAYETQYGNISISLKALQDFLGHLKNEFPTILSLVPKVRALDESLEVVLEVEVRAGAPIPEISRLLQERARNLINEKIGIADIRDIEVKVEKVVQEKTARSQEIAPMPPPAGDTP